MSCIEAKYNNDTLSIQFHCCHQSFGLPLVILLLKVKMLIVGHNPKTFAFFIAFKETKVMALKPQVGS
jgi:hypothetical protein